jgi:hypothetical protein
MPAAALPHTTRADEYREQREAFEKEAKLKVQFEDDSRAAADWIKELHALWKALDGAHAHPLIDAIRSCERDLSRIVTQLAPPDALMRLLGLEAESDLVELLQPGYDAHIRGNGVALDDDHPTHGQRPRLAQATHSPRHACTLLTGACALRVALPHMVCAAGRRGSRHADQTTQHLLNELKMLIVEIEKLCESPHRAHTQCTHSPRHPCTLLIVACAHCVWCR